LIQSAMVVLPVTVVIISFTVLSNKKIGTLLQKGPREEILGTMLKYII